MTRHECRFKIVISIYQSLLLKKDLRLTFKDNFEDNDDEFLNSILEHKPWYNNIESMCRSDYEWIEWNELIEIGKNILTFEQMSQFKMDLALLYLKRLNKIKE